MVGPVLYLAYASTLRYVIPGTSLINLNGCAGDHSLNKYFRADNRIEDNSEIKSLEVFMNDIKDWMDSNRLKMNATETEFIMFGSKKQLQMCTIEALKVNDDMVPTSEIIKYLGAWLDQHLSFKIHIIKKYQISMRNLQSIKVIHHMLSQEACHQLMLGLVMSIPDYMSVILINLPQREIQSCKEYNIWLLKLYYARTSMKSSRESLWKLHWLPIHRCIQHKVLTFSLQMYEWSGTGSSHQSVINTPKWSISWI